MAAAIAPPFPMPLLRSLFLSAVTFAIVFSAGAAPGVVTGVVTDTAGHPIAFARVIAEGRTLNWGEGQTEADHAGRYELALPPGEFTFQARREPEFVSRNYPDADCPYHCDAPGETIVVTAGARISGIDFVLKRWGSIHGRVTHRKTGLPISGATVRVIPGESGGADGSAETDSLGRYRVWYGITPGDYYVTASAPGLAGQIFDGRVCPMSCHPADGTAVIIPAYESGVTADFQLYDAGSIRGRIRDRSTGEPLASSSVEIFDSRGRNVMSLWAAPNGDYDTTSLLGPGVYYVRGRGPHHRDQLYSGIDCSSGCDPTSGTPVVIPEGGHVAGVDFHVDSFYGRLSGRVVDRWSGAPLEGVLVTFSGRAGYRAETDGAGHFEVENVWAGRYFATTFDPAGRYQSEILGSGPCGRACDATSGTPIDVNEGVSIRGIDFALSSVWISDVKPAIVPTYGGRIVIRGRGFSSGASVDIGGIAAHVESVAEDFIVAKASARPPGAADVTVRLLSGQSIRAIEPLHYSTHAPVRVKDIAKDVTQLMHRPPLGVIGNTMVFVADDPLYGNELWVSDGTPAGTRMLLDLCPGSCSSGIGSSFVAGNILYFHVVGSEDSGVSLWRTDGTATGTKELRRFPIDIRRAFDLAGDTYFTAWDEGGGLDLWRTDGTPQGTLHQFTFQSGGVSVSLPGFVVAGRTAFFSGFAENGYELYGTDGTLQGTALVSDINPGVEGSYPLALTAVGDELFFTAVQPGFGRQLWKWNAMTGVVMVTHPDQRFEWHAASLTGSIDGKLNAFVKSRGRVHLLTSDGTRAGTQSLYEFSSVANWSYLRNVLYFSASVEHGPARLWRTDGTREGTFVISTPVRPWALTRFGDELVFSFNSELWRTDGTTEGTVLFWEIDRVVGAMSHEHTPAGPNLFFYGEDAGGPGVWVSDGTRAGTRLAKRLYVRTRSIASSNPRSFATLNDTLLFVADGAEGAELWRSDGTDSGTYLVADIHPGYAGAFGAVWPEAMAVAGDALYFVADDGRHGAELWRSDGTAAGTRLVKDIVPGPRGAFSGSVSPFVAFRGAIYFSAWSEPDSHPRLWRSDGTESGTQQVSDEFFSMAIASPDLLFLTRGQPGSEGELFVTDGTTAGTRRVNTGARGMRKLAVAGNLLFFQDGEQTLWRSDGTAAGTFPLDTFDVHLQAQAAGNLLFLSAADGLWVTDGTRERTVRISEVSLRDPQTQLTRSMAGTMSLLYFVGDDGLHGPELWRSDGTPAGTIMVADLNPGNQTGLGPGKISVFGDHAYYATWIAGISKLWRSDGTPGSVQYLAGNIRPGYEVASTSTHLFFPGDDTISGAEFEDVELWAVPLQETLPTRRRAARH
jgi:ELWxxDGT repeat protein